VHLLTRVLAVAEVALSGDCSELELVVFDVLYVLPTVRMFVAYRPPNYDQNASHYVNLLLDCVDKYPCNSRSSVILGDFNLPNISWPNLHCSNDYIHQTFLSFVITRGFIQLVDFPTRERNLLDIILTDDECLVTSVLPDAPLGHSDHTSIVFTLSVSSCARLLLLTPAPALGTCGIRAITIYDNMARFLD